MVHFTSAAVLSLAAGALAAPKGLWHHKSGCMSADEAQQVATNYGDLIASYSDELANAALSKDFTDYSESVNTLIDTCPQGAAAVSLPLLSASFSNRAQFEKGQGEQAPINFIQQQLWYTCNSVHIRWETTNTVTNIPHVRPVVGLIALEVEKAPAGNQYPWIIKEVFSEFDSGAWLQNLEQAGICSQPVSSSPPVTYSGEATASATAYASATTTAYASGTAYASAAATTSYVSWAASSSPVSVAAASGSASWAAGSSEGGSSWTPSTSSAAAYSTSSAAGSWSPSTTSSWEASTTSAAAWSSAAASAGSYSAPAYSA